MTPGRMALLEAPQRFSIEQARSAEPRGDEIAVRVLECGICGSDLKMWAGTHAFLRPPLVMGHEIYGLVAQSGAASELEVGTPVVVFPPVGCGRCLHCSSGKAQLCEEMEFFGGQRPGGLADTVTVPAANTLPIPPAVPEALRVLVEPLSVAVHAVARGVPTPDERAVVLGAGAIGLLTALVLRDRGLADILVFDPVPERRLLAQRLGFATADPDAESIPDAVKRLVRPEGADCVFDCAGVGSGLLGHALAATRKGGRTIVVGNAPPVLEVDGLELQRGERSLIGVLMYDIEDFRTAMELLGGPTFAGLDPDDLIVRYALDQIDDAFRDAKSGRATALKAVVVL
jgi:threonine dehydrogenase-like Zn-dependent dehydrogenase